MTSSTRPRECDTSRYRHGCDPPQKKSKIASLSDCKGASSSPQAPIRLIQLEPFLLSLSFSISFKKKEVKKEKKGLAERCELTGRFVAAFEHLKGRYST